MIVVTNMKIIYTMMIIKIKNHRYDGAIGKNKRVIFTLNPETQKREVVGEWHFKDTNISLCQVLIYNILIDIDVKYSIKQDTPTCSTCR